MKFIKIVSKNLKLLMRSKSSAFIIIFGPLLIILLVGFALNKPATYDVSISYFTPDENNDLVNSFVDEIKKENFDVITHFSNDSCIESIKQGTSHACIIFPKNFKIGDPASNNMDFYVDYSRANLVYRIIDAVSKQFQGKTAELSEGLTQNILTKVFETKKSNDENILTIINVKAALDSLITKIKDAKSSTENLDLTLDVSIDDVKTVEYKLYDYADDLRDDANAAIKEGLDNLVSGNESTDKLDVLKGDVNATFNKTVDKHNELVGMLDDLKDELSSLEESKTEQAAIAVNLGEAETSLKSIKSDSEDVKATLEGINSNLDNLEFTSAETIVTPIKTNIKTISAQANQLIFFFPFLLMLVVMFIGIMLSSSMIVMEKQSESSFRNFTTPTEDEFFVMTTFITSLIILLIQIIVILLLAFFFLKSDLFASFGSTSIFILLSTAIFIFLGMIIGYISTTQESATMLSLAVGSVLLLLSNLILPIETMSSFVKSLSTVNPYVISSEALKKALLFNIPLKDLYPELMRLGMILVVLIALAFLINKVSNIKYLEKISIYRKDKKFYLPESSYLVMGSYVIKSKEDILNVLETMSDEEFQQHVIQNKEINKWLRNVLKARMLAFKLGSKSRAKMIEVMKKHLTKKERKDLKKETKKKEKKKDKTRRTSSSGAPKDRLLSEVEKKEVVKDGETTEQESLEN